MFHMKGKFTVNMPKKGDVNNQTNQYNNIMCAIYLELEKRDFLIRIHFSDAFECKLFVLL